MTMYDMFNKRSAKFAHLFDKKQSLLKSQKREIIRIIEDSPFNSSQFDWFQIESIKSKEYGVIVEKIAFKDSKFFFIFDVQPEVLNIDMLSQIPEQINFLPYALFSPSKETLKGQNYSETWDVQKETFKSWLMYLRIETIEDDKIIDDNKGVNSQIKNENSKKNQLKKNPHKLNDNIEVIGRISQGAYGEVWKGKDKRLNRYVAIKALHLSAPSLSNLEEHASALARVRHPNVITVYSIEKIYIPSLKSEVEAIIMEYIEGRTLSNKLGFSLSLMEAKNFGNSILDGLQAIHKVNIAHNDLHSENIIISNDSSEIKIIDLLYSSEHTFQVLSTASIESKLNRDISDVKYLLTEILEKTTDGIEYEDALNFRKEVKYFQTIEEIKTCFNKIFYKPENILEPISNNLMSNSTIIKDITKLISSLNDESLNLGKLLPKCLEIASETNNEELEKFVLNELKGWEKQDLEEFRQRYENYRSITGYFSLTAEINTTAFLGLNETMQILQNDKNFHVYNFLIIESVTALENRLRNIPSNNKETLAVIKLPLKYFGVDTGKFSPERIVPIYFPSGSYNHLYSLIRSELVKRLTGLYKILKIKN